MSARGVLGPLRRFSSQASSQTGPRVGRRGAGFGEDGEKAGRKLELWLAEGSKLESREGRSECAKGYADRSGRGVEARCAGFFCYLGGLPRHLDTSLGGGVKGGRGRLPF